jgi:creatinine amidohydrolase
MVNFWKDMISQDLNEMEKDKTVVLLPISAIEQHGSHLPVGTDSIILEALLKQFVEETKLEEGNALVAPQLFVGKSNEHMGFCGTISLIAKTLYSVIEEIVSSMVQSGFRKIIITNSHGGNTDLLNLIARDLRISYGIAVYVFDWWFTNFWADILKEEKESRSPYGVFHACELETSLILKIAPETVNKDRIIDETPDSMFKNENYISLFGPVNIGWKTKDVTQSGVIGTPSLATAEKGEKFMTYAVGKLTAIVSEVLRFQY